VPDPLGLGAVDDGFGPSACLFDPLGAVALPLVIAPLAVALRPRDVAVRINDRQWRMNVLERDARDDQPKAVLPDAFLEQRDGGLLHRAPIAGQKRIERAPADRRAD